MQVEDQTRVHSCIWNRHLLLLTIAALGGVVNSFVKKAIWCWKSPNPKSRWRFSVNHHSAHSYLNSVAYRPVIAVLALRWSRQRLMPCTSGSMARPRWLASTSPVPRLLVFAASDIAVPSPRATRRVPLVSAQMCAT